MVVVVVVVVCRLPQILAVWATVRENAGSFLYPGETDVKEKGHTYGVIDQICQVGWNRWKPTCVYLWGIYEDFVCLCHGCGLTSCDWVVIFFVLSEFLTSSVDVSDVRTVHPRLEEKPTYSSQAIILWVTTPERRRERTEEEGQQQPISPGMWICTLYTHTHTQCRVLSSKWKLC